MSFLHLPGRTRRRPLISAAVACSVLLVGCSGETDNSRETVSATTSTAEETTTITKSQPATTTSTTGTANETQAAELPVTMLGTPSMEDRPLTLNGIADLTPVAIRTGSHNGFDRFVIEFIGEGKPGWYTRYTPSPVRLGSGKDVDYQGVIALVIGVEGTPWSNTAEDREAEIKPGFYQGKGNIASIQYTGAFEAQSQFVLGMKNKVPYSISYLENPTRLVVDFAQR